MMIEVTKLKYLGGHRLHATLSDGTSGEHDFETGPIAPSSPSRKRVTVSDEIWLSLTSSFPLIRSIERAESSKSSLNRFLLHFDSDDYATARREDGNVGTFDYFFRRSTQEVDPALLSQVRKIFSSSESFDAFVSAVSQLSKAADAERSTLNSKAISTPIKTFYGIRFDKIRDGVAVASQLRPEEIDSELKDLLMRLGRKA